MHRYIIKRLLMLIPVLLGVAFIIFAIMNVAEGDPVYQVAGPDATEEQLEALREEMGLNGSLVERYFRYILNLLRGDLGTSYVSKMDVMQLYMQRLPNTCFPCNVCCCNNLCSTGYSSCCQPELMERYFGYDFGSIGPIYA